MAMRVPLQWSGGVNLNVDPRALRDNQLAYAKNAVPSLEGLIDRREPVQGVRQAFAVGANYRPITLDKPDPVTGYNFLLHYHNQVDGEYVVATNLEQESDPPTSPYIKIASSGAGDTPLAGPVQFVNYRGRSLAIGANTEGFVQLYFNTITLKWEWVKSTFEWAAGTAGTAAAQSQIVSVRPRVACSYQGRMVYANFGVGMGNWLVFADSASDVHANVTDAPLWALIGSDVLAENGRHLELREIQGENIISMREITLAGLGSQVQSALLILTEKSSIIAIGQPAETGDSAFTTIQGYVGDFQAHRITYETGIAGPSAICITPYGTFWASHDDVWFMNDNTPDPVGTNIRPALKACPPSYRKYWSMAYAGGFVYLSLVTQSVTDEYYLATQHWRLDLRQGVPENPADAKWWGPQDYEGLGPFSSILHGGELCHSLVTRREVDDKDVVYSIINVQCADVEPWLISFNQPGEGLDMPFIAPRTARAWAPLESVPAGDLIMPSITHLMGRMFYVDIAGTTGAVEPVWPTGSGAVVVDGTVQWREVNHLYRLPNYLVKFVSATLAMDIWFKDHNFGEANRDKVVRRCDIEAYFSAKQSIYGQVIVNGGNYINQLGPITIGDFTLGKTPAYNDLGLLPLDTGAVAKEYQGRTMRPAFAAGHSALPGFTQGIVRGRQLQVKLIDRPGYVIDDTNNAIIVCSFAENGGFAEGPYQAMLTNGYYETINELMTEVITRLCTISTAILGSVANYSYTDAYAGHIPYFINISKVCTTPRDTRRFGLVFGFTTVAVSSGTTFYPRRAQRLLAMLGYDTTSNYASACGFGDVLAAAPVYVIGEPLSPVPATSPATVHASQVADYQRTPPASVSNIELEVHLKKALPLSTQSR